MDLNPGDRLVFYTDGIPEAARRRRRMFGVRGGSRRCAPAPASRPGGIGVAGTAPRILERCCAHSGRLLKRRPRQRISR